MVNDELAQHLESLRREDCYRVDATLKQSELETTQLVYFVGENGAETGPFIRKFIVQTPGIGAAYERIYAAQNSGRRFKYVPDILECYTRDGQIVIVMEQVRGETLQDAIYRLDPSIELAADVFPRLCDAVSELHDELDPPIIHRDLKPSNIILSQNGLAIIDFGIAREYDSESESDTMHFGTRGFAPPEQFGFGQTTVRSDIYSLGMVLFFCLTEEMPNNATRERGFADPRVPEPIRQVIIRATAFDPAGRYASARELRQAFLDAIAQSPTPSAFDCEGPHTADRTVFPSEAAAQTATGERTPSNSSTPSATLVQPFQPHSPKVQEAPQKKTRAAVIAAACLCLVAVGIVAAIAIGHSASSQAGNSGADSTSGSTAVSLSAASADASAAASAAASGSASTSQPGEVTPSRDEPESGNLKESQLVSGLETANTPRNGFDPETNFTVNVAGVNFEIPAYFTARTQDAGNSVMHYYAETGSSVVEIMTSENLIESSASQSDFENSKDDYLAGVVESGGAFEEIVSYTDFLLAGKSARAATFRGTVKGIPVKTKMVFFYDPELQTIGSLTFGQSDNAQFDYSADFAKVVTSAQSEPR